MKKLLALLLAMLLALSCTLSLAETAEVTDDAVFQAPALTLASELDIDRDVLNNVLTTFGVGEEYIGLIDTVAAVLTEVSEQVVFADNGLEYDLFLKDTNILNLNGETTEDGLSLATSLLPSYVLTLSNDSLLKVLEAISSQLQSSDAPFDVEALVESVTGYAQAYIDSCVSAVNLGESEMGEYEVNGLTFNIKTPIDVDIPAIMEAAAKLVNDIQSDEAVQAALQAAENSGFHIALKDAEAEVADPATLPALTMDAYMNVDAEGNVSDTVDVVFEVALPGTEEPATTGDVLVEGNKVTVNVDFATADTTVVFAFVPQDAGASMRLDVNYSGLYSGLSLIFDAQEQLTCQADLFLLDADKPLVTEVASLYFDGERAAISSEGKTVYALDGLVDGSADIDELASTLGLDLVLNGLTGLLSDATQAMPEEFAPLAQMITGAIFGGEETPEVAAE